MALNRNPIKVQAVIYNNNKIEYTTRIIAYDAAIEVECGITNYPNYTCKLDQVSHIQVSLKVSDRFLL